MFKLKPKILIGLLATATLVLPLAANAVTVGTITSSRNPGSTDTASHSFSHTVAAGTDVLVVGVTNSNSAGTVSCTYNSVSMTQAVSAITGSYRAGIYYQNSPTAGTLTVECTVSSGSGSWVIGAVNLTDVNITGSPLDGTNSAIETGVTTARSVSVTTGTNNSFVLGVINYNTGAEALSTADTERWEIIHNDGTATLTGGGSSDVQVTAGANTINWTVGNGSPDSVAVGAGFLDDPPVASGGDKSAEGRNGSIAAAAGVF